MISVISAEAYDALSILCSLVYSSRQSDTQLDSILRSHFAPMKITTVERHRSELETSSKTRVLLQALIEELDNPVPEHYGLRLKRIKCKFMQKSSTYMFVSSLPKGFH